MLSLSSTRNAVRCGDCGFGISGARDAAVAQPVLVLEALACQACVLLYTCRTMSVSSRLTRSMSIVWPPAAELTVPRQWAPGYRRAVNVQGWARAGV